MKQVLDACHKCTPSLTKWKQFPTFLLLITFKLIPQSHWFTIHWSVTWTTFPFYSPEIFTSWDFAKFLSSLYVLQLQHPSFVPVRQRDWQSLISLSLSTMSKIEEISNQNEIWILLINVIDWLLLIDW